jgi:hypothetical protein
MHLYSVGLGDGPFHWSGCHLSSRQGTKTKQKGRIYDRFLKVHGDKEDADIIKN